MEQIKFNKREQRVKRSGKGQKNFIVNTTLLVSGVATSTSGLIIQYHYHLLKNPGEHNIFALNNAEWNVFHTWSSILFLTAIIYHVIAHKKWYKNVLKHILITRHRAVIILTVLAFITIISGLIPFFGYGSTSRSSIIEIHDKIAILFFVMLFHHTAKRFKWYVNTIRGKII